MECSTPGIPVHHQLSELDQTCVHQVSDIIQPSHPLSSLFPDVKEILPNRMMQEKLDSSILILEREERDSRGRTLMWDLGHLVFSFSGQNPKRVRGTEEGNNIQKGFMKIHENLMDAESLGMDYWHYFPTPRGSLLLAMYLMPFRGQNTTGRGSELCR